MVYYISIKLEKFNIGVINLKLPWDKKHLCWGVTAFCVIAASIVLFMIMNRFDATVDIFKRIFKILQPITYGIIMAYILNPFMNVVEKKALLPLFKKFSKNKNITYKTERISRVLSILISWSVVILIILCLIDLVVPEIYKSLESIIVSLPSNVNNFAEKIAELAQKNPEIVNYINVFVKGFISDFKELTHRLEEFIPNVNIILTQISSGIMGVFKVLFNIFIGIIVSIYLLKDKEKFISYSKKFIYSANSIPSANKIISIARLTHQKFGSYIVGRIFNSAIIGVLCFIILAIFRIPYAALVSVIVGVTDIIPFFGPFLGAIPSAFLILLVDPIKSLTFIIIVTVIQQFDGNILGPKILGDSIGISGFWVMFAIFIGSGLFGVWGMICSVPVFGVIYVIIKENCNRTLAVKGISFTDEEFEKIVAIDEKTGKAIPNEK